MQLILYLLKRFCPFNPRIIQVMVGAVTAALLGAVLALGWNSSRKVKEVVTADFNSQQLVLAQHAARMIENRFSILQKELNLLSLSTSVQHFERGALERRLGIAYERVKDEGAFEVRYIETTGTHLMDAQRYRVVPSGEEDRLCLERAMSANNRGTVLHGRIVPVMEGNRQRLTARLAMPVWKGVSHGPPAPEKFSGVLALTVDVTEVIGKITSGIRSGKTGYAWVMDDTGTFLYHPEREFIGKNAFEARKERKPTISFARINSIQEGMMLAGKEGTSWYISGWHRGLEGEMKKLISYTPIRIGGGHLWSVAVVAPVSEVEDAVHSIHIRQSFLQGIIIAVILIGGLVIISLMVGWSRSLELEVEKKTKEVKNSEQRYKSLVENAEDIVFTVDYGGNFLSVNGYGARCFGKSPEEIVGRSMSEVLAWSGAEALLMTVKEVFDTRKGKQITHMVRIGEREHWFNTNLRRLFDESGNIYAVLGISRDITERKKLEENFYRTEKLASMGTLAAGVAHEINNPLGIILGYADLLMERTAPGSKEYDMLKKVEKHGLRAKAVVENLLSFARCSEHREEPVDVNECLRAVLAVAGNTFLTNKIQLKEDLREGLPTVKGYADELQQVFFNIINNAVAAMNGGGTLGVCSRAVNGYMEVEISDTGHGIRKEHRGRIFDPLFTTKNIGEGTGLGLSVSYGIISKHNGTIDFETTTAEESDRTGTSFTIRLPAADRDGPEVSAL